MEIETHSFPFPYLIIKNAFGSAIAEHVSSFMNMRMDAGVMKSDSHQSGAEVNRALVYTPTALDLKTSPLSRFTEDSLRICIASALSVPSNDCMMLLCHRHLPPSVSGVPHTDFGVVSFPKYFARINGHEHYQSASGVEYADDSADLQPKARKVVRAIACIYYIGISEWSEGDGGETALFEMRMQDPARTVAPLNDTLLAFETSPHSLHGYLGSRSLTRDSVIWWYHCEVEDALVHHERRISHERSQGRDPWTRMAPPNVARFVDTL